MQHPDLLRNQTKEIELQEAELVFSSFDNKTAFELGCMIRDRFNKDHNPVEQGIVISITLFSGHILFQCAVGNPGKLGPDNWDWVRRKSNTVKRFGHSSFLVGRQRLLKGKDLDGLGPDYAAHGGGFPITIEDCNVGPVGVIVVSGLSQEEDHDLIAKSLKEFIFGP